MKIVVLDGHTLNPGDLEWSALQALGELQVHERTPPELAEEHAADAEIVLTNKTLLPAPVINALPKLRYIGVLATGYNVVDVQAAAARKIPVANVPGYGTASVAQHTWALILELTNNAGLHAESVGEGGWAQCPDFCYWISPLRELTGKSLGIVGYGAIGSAVADVGRAFGMQIIASGRSPKPGVEMAGIDDLFRRADVVSLHCPLTDETKGMVNKARLSMMKPDAFLVNTSRGPLVVEQDLADALNDERIAGAALDVLSVEPPHADNPLLKAKNCLVTPHQAWASKASRQRLMDEAVENVRAFLAGKPRNIVNEIKS